jgi:hypothetical protein
MHYSSGTMPELHDFVSDAHVPQPFSCGTQGRNKMPGFIGYPQDCRPFARFVGDIGCICG